ncbi:hypothetical protein Ahia01_001249500 [Argonauta hians]
MADTNTRLKHSGGAAVATNEINAHEIPAKLKYMHRPPRITPNYGNMASAFILKTKLSRVLLYDNVTQQFLLGRKLKSLSVEQEKAARLCDLHRKTFFNQSHLRDIRQHHFTKRTELNRIKDGKMNSNHANVYSRKSLSQDSKIRRTELPPLRIASSKQENTARHSQQSHRRVFFVDSSKTGLVEYQKGKPLKLDKRFLSLEKLLIPFSDPRNAN